MVLVLFPYCIAEVSTPKKYVNPLSDHWWSNPLNFRQHPSAHKAATGTNIMQACSSRILQLSNGAEILPRVASEREQEAASELFYPIIVCSEILR